MDKIKLGQGYIKNRLIQNDKIYTPIELAKLLITHVPLKNGDIVLDPCRGGGAFYDNYPSFVEKDYCEIDEGKDFFLYENKVDWCVSNPPFSMISDWLIKTCKICKKGFGYIFGNYNLTPNRIHYCNERGYYLIYLKILKVRKWVGRSFFVVFSKQANENIIDYDLTDWKANDQSPKIKHNFKDMESWL